MNYHKLSKNIIKFINNANRCYLIVGFFVVFFLFIMVKMFSYTVLNYSFYKDLADKQQIGKVVLPVTRGTIYSSTNNGTVFGTSVNLYDIAVDPKIEGDKTKLASFLTDVTYMQLCYLKDTKECYEGVLKFLKLIEIENFSKNEEIIKNMLREYLSKKLSQTKVTSVFIDRELDNEQITQVINLGIVGLYPSGNFLYVNPEELIDYQSTAKKLSILLGMNEERLRGLLKKRDLRYIAILNRLSIGVSEYIKKYLDDEDLALRKGVVNKKDSIGGFIILTPNPNRYYPESHVASQNIGFVDKEGEGHYGIEGYFDGILKGNNGQIVSRKDIMGRIIDPIGLKQSDIIGEGVKIYSTIDRNIQTKVEEILEAGVVNYRANKGTIVVMEPKTGRILSMANYPTYNLNDYSDVYELEKVKYSKYPDPKIDLLGMPVFVEDRETGDEFYYDSKKIFLRKATRDELGDIALVKYKYKNNFGPLVYKNDAISSLYEPGSIMKAMTVAIGLDTSEISRWSMYNDIGKVTIADHTIENDSDKCLGYHSFAHALNYSCNIGMVRIAQRLGKVLMHQYIVDFGFGELTGISLAGEVFSSIDPYEGWAKSQLLTTSYGLGVAVTPLQMASAYSVLANGGYYIKPQIIDYIEYPTGRKVVYGKEIERKVIKESTSKVITSMLVSSTSDGVARNGSIYGYSLAGKTGTAQIPYKGGYEEGIGSTIASFAGYGPAEDPKFVIIVKLDRPRSNPYGGQTAAYIFRDISEYLLNYYSIPKKIK